MSFPFFILCQFSVIAFALLGGVFLVFSDFIMRALARTSGAGGAEAMQIINREVFRSAFMPLFLGMVPVSLIIVVDSALTLSGPIANVTLLAGIIYLVAAFGVTLVFNVPLNETLDKMDKDTEATRSFWLDTYVPKWTFWNSVRSIACVISCGLLLGGLSMTVASHPI